MKNKKLLTDLSILAGSILFTFLMDKFDFVLKLEQVIISDYILAFLAGIFFISFFTVVPASFILINLIGDNNILIIALIAGIGAMTGDLLIFLFVKNRLSNSFFSFLKLKNNNRLEEVKDNKITRLFLPIIGAAIIASPFPDEIGVALMGASKMERKYFIPVVFILNSIGIYLLLLVSSLVS